MNFRGEVGKWIALITVFVRLFYPCHFSVSQQCSISFLLRPPEWFKLPGAVILLIAVAPNFVAYNLRFVVGDIASLVIGSVLLSEHIKASGGFREAFKKGKGLTNTIGILLLFIYPAWILVVAFIYTHLPQTRPQCYRVVTVPLYA
ncbi:hypothetical protein PR202_ga13614 [Eleusine coracana subsp. coracana]|uniref:Uncharacterized protein n=1 Tax=Eleusine coracana subsp. coracana TaxID=191504 RepID=A0AAV5CFD8_ELECO|nr:hypothetical protein PR202_ga13614 [Eleusine coracana subsp. coracana]